MIKKKTPVATVSAKTTDAGITFGEYGYPNVGGLEWDDNSEQLTLWINQEQAEELGITIRILDCDLREQ